MMFVFKPIVINLRQKNKPLISLINMYKQMQTTPNIKNKFTKILYFMHATSAYSCIITILCHKTVLLGRMV